MFNFPNLINDFKQLKFDSVSQALASSQTLVSSFKSSVASLVSKLINQDALIKGQTNGPENTKVLIQDSIADLENIRDSYRVNLQTIRDLSIPAFVPSEEEAQSITINGNSGMTVLRGGLPILNCKLNLSPTQVNDFVQSFSLCQLPSDMLFIPKMDQNTARPSNDGVMYYANIQGSATVNASNSYHTATYNGYSDTIWISIRPLALGNTISGSNRWRDGLITHDPIDIGNGKVAHINICLVQTMQWVEHGSNHDYVPGVGLFFSAAIADANDVSLSGDVVYKNASFFNYTPTLQSNPVRADNVLAYTMIRNESNGSLNVLEHTYAGINANLDTNNPSPNLRHTFHFDNDSLVRHVASQLSGYSEQSCVVYDVPSSATPQESDAIDQFTMGALSFNTATVRTDDGYILTALSADITSIVGNLTSEMNSIIDDLNNGTYE